MRTRWRWFALVPVVVLVILTGMHVLAQGHMREMAASGAGTSSACTMCHGAVSVSVAFSIASRARE